MSRWILFWVLTVGCSSGTNRVAHAAAPQPPDVDRGVELYQQREFGQAAQVLERATDSAPGDARAWTYLGLSRLELKQYPGAEEAFRKAISLDEKSTQAHFGLGLANGYLGRTDEAIAELERALAIDPQYAYAHYHLGLAYNQRGQKDKALLHLQRFLELAPDSPEAPRVKALLSKLR